MNCFMTGATSTVGLFAPCSFEEGLRLQLERMGVSGEAER